MEIKANPKFNVGAIVKIRGTTTNFMIVQVLTITCPGGTQISYEGRVLMPEKYSLKTDRSFSPAIKYDRFNEIELESLE